MGLRESARRASERIREGNTGCSGPFVFLASFMTGAFFAVLDRLFS